MFILSGARIATKPKDRPVTRSDTLGIVMGVKTIVVLLYQILSSHAERFRKWASLKAYAILNFMEILFWFVVVIITFMGIAKFCSGVSCGLTWVSVLIAIMLCVLASWTAVVSFQDLRNLKKRGNLGYAASNRLP
ncbi:hypothetical protein V496_00458 [Pseudogymnoascus sp. VKM F-4515 (FW-2607)]|nr:hypothetical protein V496_00458 [Pseudogymnoascus sp. VKM F-4515 (FW-2607)]KFY94632.1 hypothetical protein V498_03814 [Pseudogymnoascus sp. VKM F-4517 (FW-2822)]